MRSTKQKSAWCPQPLESANISSGRRIATTICVDCHEVSGKTEIGPNFEDIANQSVTAAILLKAFLRSNHRNMPNFILSRTETDDVIAYILSLKRK
jgi:mono/diheme cytochrome c family protein